MAGIRTKADDIFTKSAFDGKLEFVRGTRNEYSTLDFGLLGGLGFKLKRQPKSMSLGLRYYYGLVDVSTLPDTSFKNTSVYLFAKIPIGIAKKKETKKNSP
jgi:hypothetical protein